MKEKLFQYVERNPAQKTLFSLGIFTNIEYKNDKSLCKVSSLKKLEWCAVNGTRK